VRELVESSDPFVSPVVELELTYLYEVGRVNEPAEMPLASLRRSIDLQIADVGSAELMRAAMPLSWTRDPFDRLISAHAILADAPLITADETIRANLPQATWS
jgi:PIN domain nuclease of toxin-antitoxin system